MSEAKSKEEKPDVPANAPANAPIEELVQRLGEAETTMEALMNGRLSTADAALCPIPALLRQAQQALVTGVTEQRKLEAEAGKLQEELSRCAAELAAVHKELEAFSYSISHDLRAPLRSIHGFSKILLEDHSAMLDEKGKGCLERVCVNVQRMEQRIEDLTSLSRVTRMEMRRGAVDLSTLAQAVASRLTQRDPERRVDFKIAPGLSAYGDASLLQLVMKHLIHNAWKFTSKHEQARIEVGMLHQHGNPVYFVRDDGAGFDGKYAHKLFGAFQRLHSPTEFEGDGIGLAMVQRIINRHRGRVWIEGAVEQGATVYFTL